MVLEFGIDKVMSIKCPYELSAIYLFLTMYGPKINVTHFNLYFMVQ